MLQILNSCNNIDNKTKIVYYFRISPHFYYLPEISDFYQKVCCNVFFFKIVSVNYIIQFLKKRNKN